MLWSKDSAKASTKQIGDQGELIAKRYLLAQGLKIVTQNFHCRLGEIDIIAKSADCFIFIEVKFRHQNQFGGAISAVSASKQDKIKKSARIYLQQQQLNEYNTACRFDVIALDGDRNQPQITWLTNAF